MKGFNKLSALLTLVFFSHKAASAPLPATETVAKAVTDLEGITFPSIDPSESSELTSNSALPSTYRRRRSLSSDVEPLLALLQPLLGGLDAGLQQGAGNVKAAMDSVGAAANQALDGVGDTAAGTTAGLGGTVQGIPASLYHTTKNLETNKGLVGEVISTVTGAPSDDEDE